MEPVNNNHNYNQTKEFDNIIKKRDRERFSRELVDLERQEANIWNRILLSVISFLIVEPILAAVAMWYLWDQFASAFRQGMLIQNFSSSVKFTAIGIAVAFTLTSLNLIYHLWHLASLKKEMVKLRAELVRLG